jgi:Integrase core domain
MSLLIAGWEMQRGPAPSATWAARVKSIWSCGLSANLAIDAAMVNPRISTPPYPHPTLFKRVPLVKLSTKVRKNEMAICGFQIYDLRAPRRERRAPNPQRIKHLRCRKRVIRPLLAPRNFHIDPGKPWQNGTNESFNGKFRDECLSMGGKFALFSRRLHRVGQLQ